MEYRLCGETRRSKQRTLISHCRTSGICKVGTTVCIPRTGFASDTAGGRQHTAGSRRHRRRARALCVGLEPPPALSAPRGPDRGLADDARTKLRDGHSRALRTTRPAVARSSPAYPSPDCDSPRPLSAPPVAEARASAPSTPPPTLLQSSLRRASFRCGPTHRFPRASPRPGTGPLRTTRTETGDIGPARVCR